MLSALFAAAVLTHLAEKKLVYTAELHGLLALLCVTVIVLPSLRVATLALVGLQLVALYGEGPQVGNHWLFTGILCATCLGAYLHRAACERRLDVDSEALYRSIVPLTRMLVLLLYLFAFLHKLNWEFLDPEASCATFIFRHRYTQHWFDPETVSAAEGILPWLGLAVEGAVPLLLLFARRLGLLLGLIFHFTTSLFLIDFPTLLVALYFVFLPYDAERPYWHRVDAAIRGSSRGVLSLLRLVRLYAALLLYAHTIHASGWIGRGPYLAHWWLFALGLGLYAGVLALRHGLYRFPEDHAPGLPHPAFAAFGLLLALAGLSPYLGLRTVPAFSMFSNLRTEPGAENHLLLARLPRLFRVQDDFVAIEESEVFPLRSAAHTGEQLHFLTLRREIRSYLETGRASPDRARLVYHRGGERVEVENAYADGELNASESFLERKLLLFRRLPAPAYRDCQW